MKTKKSKYVVYEPVDGEVYHDSLKSALKDIKNSVRGDLNEYTVYKVQEVRENITKRILERYFTKRQLKDFSS